MPSYTLTLQIDREDLRILKAAQQRIILAKPVNDVSPNVSWLSIDPFEGNEISWTEDYSLYGSNTQIQNGATIHKMSSTDFPSPDAAYFTFKPDATFYGPTKGGVEAPGRGQYRIFNDMPVSEYPALTFGLQQGAKFNGKDLEVRPVNAALVPAGQNTTFTPLSIVHAWLETKLMSGIIITEVRSKTAVVTFGGSVTSVRLKYNPAEGMFTPLNPDTGKFLGETANVQLRVPSAA